MGEDGVDADVVVQGRNKSSLGGCWIDWSNMFFSGEAVIGFISGVKSLLESVPLMNWNDLAGDHPLGLQI